MKKACRFCGQVAAALLLTAPLLLGCSSESDLILPPEIEGSSAALGGIYEATIRSDGDTGNWVLVFGDEAPDGADNRLVAYRQKDTLDEFITGRFVVNDSTADRRANVLWFDMVEVEPELEDITPGEEEEPEFERRVRPAVMNVRLTPDGRVFGTLSGDDVDSTLDGRYAENWYERISSFGLSEGEWRDLDPFGRENISLEFDETGGFGGRNIEDCTLAGQLSLINTRFNLYEFFLASRCNETLDATGLATIRPASDNPSVDGPSTLIAIVPYRDGSEVLGFFLTPEREPRF
jgi:hypothetical protein